MVPPAPTIDKEVTAKRRDLRYWHKADIPELTLQCPLLGVKRLHPLTVVSLFEGRPQATPPSELGTITSTVTPLVLPTNDRAIGELTEIFPL